VKNDCLRPRKDKKLSFVFLNLRFGNAIIAQCLVIRTVNDMTETNSQERFQKPLRKTRIINFSIVVDYDIEKWEDDLFGVEVELSSRVFDPNEERSDVHVLRTYTLNAFDLP